MNQTNNRIREEWRNTKFPELWAEDSYKSIADWWLSKLDLALEEERKRITGIIRQVGALENDEEVEKLINTINYKND